LIVEDNDINQHLMLLLLNRMGYRADVAGNGIEALQAIQRQPYDVVLMDVQMPDMDGFATTQRIRQEFPAAEQPRIIAMTANAMRGDREMCLAAGMDDYMSKPIFLEDLIGCLNRSSSREVREPSSMDLSQVETEGENQSLLASGIPVLDMAELLRLQENLGYKSDVMLPPLVASFFKQVERLIEDMKQALAAGDCEKLRRAAHTLKSNGATFGARRLEAAARFLEENARQGTVDRAGELIRLSEIEYQRARSALQEAQAAILRKSEN
jgi:CheY-like chemotaxis protein